MIFDLQLFSVGETGIQLSRTNKVVEINNAGGAGAGTDWTAGNSVYIGLSYDTRGYITGVSASASALSAGIATGKSGVAGLMRVSSITAVGGWSPNSVAKITNVSLTGELMAGDMEPFGLKINNGYVSNISLGKWNMDLILTDVGVDSVSGNNKLTVDDLAATNRKITFDGSEEIYLVNKAATTTKGTAEITNGTYTSEVLAGTEFGQTSIVGSANKLEFRTNGSSELRFGASSDSVFVNMAGETGTAKVQADGVELLTVNNLQQTLDIKGIKNSNVLINGQADKNAFVKVYDTNGKSQGADKNSSVSIIGAEDSSYSVGGVLANLSGTGIEYINIGNHGAGVVSGYGVDSLGKVGNANAESLKNGWVFTNRSIVGAKGANVVSIGDHDILDIEGAIWGNKTHGSSRGGDNAGSTSNQNLAPIGKVGTGRLSKEGDLTNQYMYLGTHLTNSGDTDKTGEQGAGSVLAITAAANNGEEKGALFGSYEGVAVEAKGKTYNALMMSDDALDSLDTGLNWSSYDIVVGDILNLGNRTDKKVVYLNNGLGKNDWGETISYSANMTSVISSTAGKSVIIGDFENKINFRSEGHLDSLYGGRAYGVGGFDTLSSAAGKKAWMGTGKDSGATLVQLTHNGSDTYNFGFVGESYTTTDSTGASVSVKETEDTADVLALMNGMGHYTLEGSEHGRANFEIGSSKANYFKFQSITEGVHDIMYTYDLGANNFVARVDTSLTGSTSGFNFSDDIDWFFGFDNGTILSMNAEDTGKMVNYGGKNVITGISVVDGSDAAGGNILNGQVDHAERIIASEKVGDTLCGGISAKDTDTASDTLVGGAGADVFQVGANLGDDTLLNVGDGDTIIFLDSKFADVKLNYENERMTDYSDSHWMTATFSDDAGGAKISITPGNGLTDHMSDVKNLTAIFRSDGVDDVYTWDGKAWTQATEA
jgi:hypothetical protein